MAINFPSTSGQATDGSFTHTENGVTWSWDGTTWKATGIGAVETDPVYSASAAANVTSTKITEWDTAYGWGNHAAAGYLTSLGDAAGVTTAKIANWDTAYGWGDHSTQGYLTTVALNDVSDVTITTPSNGEILTYNGSGWVNSAPTGGVGLQSRTTAQGTTSNIADGTSDYITITAEKTYVLHKIQTSHAAWVTLYTDTGSRTNDATRNENTNPVPGSGVIAEIITSDGAIQRITPGTIGWNDDVTPSTNVYLKVVNKSGSNQAITVTLYYVALEG